MRKILEEELEEERMVALTMPRREVASHHILMLMGTPISRNENKISVSKIGDKAWEGNSNCLNVPLLNSHNEFICASSSSCNETSNCECSLKNIANTLPNHGSEPPYHWEKNLQQDHVPPNQISFNEKSGVSVTPTMTSDLTT